MYSPYDDIARDEIEHDRAMLRLYDSRDLLLYQLSKVAKDPYLESFLGMFLFSLDNDEPNAMRLAKEFDMNQKDIVILKEDVKKFIEIEIKEGPEDLVEDADEYRYGF
jgi:hypothetical protein